MDKKNTVIGVMLIGLAIACLYWMPRPAPLVPPPAVVEHPASPTAPKDGTAVAPAAVASTPASTPTPSAPNSSGVSTTEPANAPYAIVHADSATATVTTLRNSFIEVRFTDSGGAIREVALINRDNKGRLVYPEDIDRLHPFVFNAQAEDPMLAFADFPGLDRGTRFERVSATDIEVVYRAIIAGHFEVTRKYTLPPDASDKTDPYQLRHETTIRNLAEQPTAPMKVSLAVGTVAPTENDPGIQLSTGYYTGSDLNFTSRSALDPSGGFMFGLGAHGSTPSITQTGSLTWAAVKNQFFTAILAPDQPAASIVTRRVKMRADLSDENAGNFGISARVQFDVKALAPKAEAKIATSLYVGPKEYARLAKPAVFKVDQDKVMNFGTYFGWASKLLLILMTWVHGIVGNWGVAIVLTTLSLKLIFVPLTLKSSKSMKRMAKLQPLVTAAREKYKDNPAKQQAAMMEIYKENKVNPMGGCLPMLIPIPFFIGFFSMLQGTAELRFASFLWVQDLSATDTVAVVFGIPIHLLPLLFTAVTFFQMRLTPTPNADPAQAKMMQFMPLIFLFIYYSMPAALSLYSAANAIFTIFQQIAINRMKDPLDVPGAVTVGPGGKPVKNVTPRKK